MIASELRAQAWKWACAVLAVLAVAAVCTAIFLGWRVSSVNRGYDRAISGRDAARAEIAAYRELVRLDNIAIEAGTEARQQIDQQAAQANDRKAQIEVKYRERIVEVPADCPVPDADLLRELQEQRGRISAAEDRLRGVGPAAADVSS